MDSPLNADLSLRQRKPNIGRSWPLPNRGQSRRIERAAHLGPLRKPCRITSATCPMKNRMNAHRARKCRLRAPSVRHDPPRGRNQAVPFRRGEKHHNVDQPGQQPCEIGEKVPVPAEDPSIWIRPSPSSSVRMLSAAIAPTDSHRRTGPEATPNNPRRRQCGHGYGLSFRPRRCPGQGPPPRRFHDPRQPPAPRK